MLIHCNARIIIIDFNVLESKTYSFFINEELCEIELERRGELFYYHFHINETADTPRNRAKKQIERKHWKQTLFMAGGIAVAIVILLFVINRFKTSQVPAVQELHASLSNTQATRIFLELPNNTIRYEFVVNNKIYTSQQPFGKTCNGLPCSAFGWPLNDGDEFMVQYLPSNPYVNEVLLDQPSESQIAEYAKLAIEQHLQAHPELVREEAQCAVQAGLQSSGVAALADFYFQGTRPSKNEFRNERTYRQLTQSPAYQEKWAELCGAKE